VSKTECVKLDFLSGTGPLIVDARLRTIASSIAVNLLNGETADIFDVLRVDWEYTEEVTEVPDGPGVAGSR
jgi:hypothetical protein